MRPQLRRAIEGRGIVVKSRYDSNRETRWVAGHRHDARQGAARRALLASTAIGTLALLTLASHQAFAADRRLWEGGTSTDWHTGSNWVGGVAPITGDSAVINNASVATLGSGTVTLGTLFGLSISVDSGSLVVEGTSTQLNTGRGDIGDYGAGKITVRNSASWLNSADLYLAATNTSGASGTLEITSGGKVTNEAAFIGASKSGSVIVQGTGSTWTSNGFVVFGLDAQSSGRLEITDRGNVTSTNASVGSLGAGFVSVTDSGSLWDSGSLSLGSGSTGSGTLEINHDGKVVSSAALVGGDGTGKVLIDGGTWEVATSVLVAAGNGGTGKLEVRGGGKVSSTSGKIGGEGGASNTVLVTGADSKWVISGPGLYDGDLYLGGDAASYATIARGSLTVADGGVVEADHIRIAPDGNGRGIINIGAAPGSAAVAPGTLTLTGGILVGDGSGQINFNHTSGGYSFDDNLPGHLTVNAYAGTTVLGGVNTYTGGTNIHGGTLTFSGAGTLGDAGGTTRVLGGTLDLAGTAQTQAALLLAGGTVRNGSLNAPITSTGGVIDSIGGSARVTTTAGTTLMTGTNPYTGPTSVNGGTLRVDGTITGTSSVDVNSGGTLAGIGTIDPLTVAINNGGTFAPGNGTPGTFTTIVGNLAFQSGALYRVQVDPSTASFAKVSGAATLAGATVGANFAPGSYVARRYTILDAAGGVSGTFAGPVNTNLPSGFVSGLGYDATHAYLVLDLFRPDSLPGLNRNQQAVAAGLRNAFDTTGGIPMVFGALDAQGLTQVSGELATGAQQATFDAMTLFMGVMTDPSMAGRDRDVRSQGGGASQYAGERDPLAYAANGRRRSAGERDAYAAIHRKAPPRAFEEYWSVWGAGYGGSQSTDGSGATGSHDTTSSIYGGAAGADYHLSPDTSIGFALAGGGTQFRVDGAGTGRSDLFQAGAFLRHTQGPAYITAAFAYGWQNIATERTVTVAGVDRLRASFDANAFSGRVEGGWRLAPSLDGLGLTAYAAGQTTLFDLPAYAEQAFGGANAFALSYAARDVNATRSELGLRAETTSALADAMLTLRGRAAWAHNFNTDRSARAVFQTLPGSAFVVNGAAQAANSALVTASAEVRWPGGWSVAGAFEGEFSNVTQSYAGKGVIRYTW